MSQIENAYPVVFLPGNFHGFQRLIVYPVRGNKIEIPLPFDLSTLIYSPDGKVLYGQEAMRHPPKLDHPGLFKIEFNPTRFKLLPGSAELQAHSIAVSQRQDKIVFYGKKGRGALCGIYELNLADGVSRPVLPESACRPESWWTYLTLSPDGQNLLGIHHKALMVVHLVDGTVKSLGDGFTAAAWSPNGKWIATRGNREADNTILLDAASFAPKRTLPQSSVEWSPDSLYLLAYRPHLLCGLYTGSLEIIDVETGKHFAIHSSRCQIDEFMGRGGWLSNDVLGADR